MAVEGVAHCPIAPLAFTGWRVRLAGQQVGALAAVAVALILTCGNVSAPGRIRTCDTGFRRAVLYPLSYEGGDPSEQVLKSPRDASC